MSLSDRPSVTMSLSDRPSVTASSSLSFYDQYLSPEQGLFYNDKNYETTTQNDLKQKNVMQSYSSNTKAWETETKVHRFCKKLLRVIFWPITLISYFIGRFLIVPASRIDKAYLDARRQEIKDNKDWKYKRVTIAVDDLRIDAMILGTEETFKTRRWLLASLGNGESYEEVLTSNATFWWGANCPNHKNNTIQQLLQKTNSNGIVFNYPSVGASQGPLSKATMIKAYQAVLRFLEDQERGIGAEEILCYGFSIGGGVQGEALKTHQLKQDIKYVFIKDRSFSRISKVVSSTFWWIIELLLRIFGWEMNSLQSSKQLQHGEVIIQHAKNKPQNSSFNPGLITDASQIFHDAVIPQKASLGYDILRDSQEQDLQRKRVVGVLATHNETIYPADMENITAAINELLTTDDTQSDAQDNRTEERQTAVAS